MQDQKKKLSDEVVEYVLTLKFEELEILSVENLARNFNINRRKLLRSFKIERKMTLKEFLFRVRIMQAAFFLQENEELSVKEIGEKIGYYSYNYFIHIFKRYMGASPGRYRELKRGKYIKVKEFPFV